jgi:hypothetical protein
MHKKFIRTLSVTGLFTLAITIPHPTLAMDDGEAEYKAYQKYCRSNHGLLTTPEEIAKKKWKLQCKAARAGHLEAQRNCINGCKPKNRAYWENLYNNNPKNPNYTQNQEKSKRESDLKAKQLELDLEQAKIRRMELERQPVPVRSNYSSNTNTGSYQSRNNNNLERNIRVADEMVNLTNDSVNLYNNIQGSNFGGF